MRPAPQLRILADDLTGALDCAAAFGAGVPVHLGQASGQQTGSVDIVATATRDEAPSRLPELLTPSLAWLRGGTVAFKKIDSLLRGNTFDEVDWLARQAPAQRLALAPAFPAQRRVTQGGQQWVVQDDGTRTPVAASMRESLHARGWRIDTGPQPPSDRGHGGNGPLAWVPDAQSDADLDRIAQAALQAGAHWLWCGSAGLAHALSRQRILHRPALAPMPPAQAGRTGLPMLVSASHHPVSQEQWRVLRAALGAQCHRAEDPVTLQAAAMHYPALIDLSATTHLTAQQAADLLLAQASAIAKHAPRPSALVVVGGDTLLALCKALGVTALRSGLALDRPGWGCAQLVGGRWDGLLCHTRSGAFGGPQDLLEVIGQV